MSTARPRRRIVLGLIALAAAIAAGVGIVFALDDAPRRSVPAFNPARAERQARVACAALGTFELQVGQNVEARKVLANLDDARRRATDAADRDPRWRSLASGADALGVAIRKDNAAAARVGIDVVRAQCAELS